MTQSKDASQNHKRTAKRISVFGGSSPKTGESAYQQAYDLGKRLAQVGHTVMTGGYIGTMEAASRGAAEANGHVIGVTCDEIEHWRPVKANKWVGEEIRFSTLRERLHYLIETCDAALALPGGIGTLAEIAVMWSHLQTGVLKDRELILVGEGWRDTFLRFIDDFGPYIKPEYRGLLTYAPDIESAFSQLQESFGFSE